jgi:hypothetical protein
MLLAPHIFISPMEPKPSIAKAPWLIIPYEFDMVEIPHIYIMGLRGYFNWSS